MKEFKVHFTKDLKIFKYHSVNRDVMNKASQNRIQRIAESMKKELKKHPIIVTNKMIIVDGQHRVKAAEIAECGIYYIIDESIPNTAKGIFDAAKEFNKNAKEWSKKDYITGYANQGNDSYQKLNEFGEKFPMFSLTERLMLLQNSGTKHANKKEFAEGKFTVRNFNTAEKWANHLLELKPYFEKGYNRSNFVRTILTIMEKKKGFKFEEFLHKVRLRPGSLYLCGDKRAYSTMIEDIYNYRRKVDEKLNLRL
jgi:hypothetical protein